MSKARSGGYYEGPQRIVKEEKGKLFLYRGKSQTDPGTWTRETIISCNSGWGKINPRKKLKKKGAPAQYVRVESTSGR